MGTASAPVAAFGVALASICGYISSLTNGALDVVNRAGDTCLGLQRFMVPGGIQLVCDASTVSHSDNWALYLLLVLGGAIAGSFFTRWLLRPPRAPPLVIRGALPPPPVESTVEEQLPLRRRRQASRLSDRAVDVSLW